MMMEPQTTALTRVRRIIADRMHNSLRSTAQLTSVVEADFTRFMDARRKRGEAFKTAHGVALSPLAGVARASILALAEHPLLNSVIDIEEQQMTHYRHVNLGIAVDTDAGLIVPNLKSAQRRNLAGLSAGIADVALRARSHRLRPEDLEGGTFTITNTGSRGSLLDTPILNAPEVGILAVGKVERRPVVCGEGASEQIEIRDMAYLCLTYDHRLVDGAEAARFLEDVRSLVHSDALIDPAELQLESQRARNG